MMPTAEAEIAPNSPAVQLRTMLTSSSSVSGLPSTRSSSWCVRVWGRSVVPGAV